MTGLSHMEKIAEMALLLDFYGPLLTAKQRDYLDLYFQQDLSLREIAELKGVSPQAAHDIIRRSVKQLRGYEADLGLVKQYFRQRELVQEGMRLLAAYRDEGGPEKLTRLEEIFRDLLQQ